MKKRFLAALAAFIILAGPGYALAQQQATRPLNIQLQWTDNSNNEDGFDIDRAIGLPASSPMSRIARVGANVVQYIDAVTDPGNTTYCYRVSAYNAAGSSGFSNTSCVTTPAIITVPANPTTLTCSVTLAQGTQPLTITCQ